MLDTSRQIEDDEVMKPRLWPKYQQEYLRQREQLSQNRQEKILEISIAAMTLQPLSSPAMEVAVSLMLCLHVVVVVAGGVGVDWTYFLQ